MKLLRRPGGRGAPVFKRPPPAPVFHKGWERIICVASGPSLTAEQGFLISCASGWKVIAINNTWQRVPMADVLYACDQQWWKRYHMDVAAKFRGECWTGDRWAAHKYGLCHVQLYDKPGLCLEHGTIYSGANSGYQAVNLAYHFGAREILLVGYDMQMTYGMSHWHGDHPQGLIPMPAVGYSGSGCDPEFPQWVDRFEVMADDLHSANVAVTNCSIETALPWFPRAELSKCL
jgi:hypothetical protein